MKRQRRFTGFDEKILALFARGMTVRDMQGHLEEIYSTEASPNLISRATGAVADDIKDWRNRPGMTRTIVYLDARVVKICDDGTARNRSAHIALGVTVHGTREILWLGVDQAEGAKLWPKILNELKTRGVQDLLIVCCQYPSGEAIRSGC